MKANTKKIADFFKRNAYYIVMAVCVLAIITMVTLALVLSLATDDSPTVDADGSLVGDVVDTTPGSNSSNDVDAPVVDTPVVDDKPVVDTPVVDDKPVEDTPVVDDNPVETPLPDTDTPVTDPTPDVDPPVSDITPDDPTVDVDTAPSFVLPLDNYTLIKGYSSIPVYNSSLKRYVAHKGIDLAAESGANVKAIAAGTVENVTYDILYGNQVTILHADGVRSIYKSIDNVSVSAGDAVTVGQAIGIISTSAGSEAADGEHLHLEITVGGEPVDPVAFAAEIKK